MSETTDPRPSGPHPADASASTPTPASPPPGELAGYRIDRVLATGGMGAVYLVHSPVLPRREALKLLSAELTRDPRMRTRFLTEADITASLDHRNIVRVYNRGETDDGQLWIAMEYVAGTDAETALRSGPMPPARALHIISEVARALDYAHRAGVVHQDIKPSNFLLGEQPGENERVVLSDFGVALAADSADSGTGPMAATLAYAAPEVITGTPVDRRADVYSLGCTLFRLLTGRYPFPDHDDVAALIGAHLHAPPPRISDYLPWATPQLDEVVATALAKDPARRYPSAGDLAAAAAAALSSGGTPAPRRPAPKADRRDLAGPTDSTGTGSAAVDFTGHLPHTQPRPAGRSRRRLLLGVGSAAAVAVLGLGIWLALPASPPASRAPVTTSSTAASSDPAAAATLTTLLPAGYRSGSCASSGTDAELAAAALSCGPNTDPGGPPTATYTLARSRTALQTLFDREVAAASPVVCPGNIQSPGPWRRLANPAVPQGTVFCGVRGGEPVVAWSTEDKLLLAVVTSANPGHATLDQLYTWWASHS